MTLLLFERSQQRRLAAVTVSCLIYFQKDCRVFLFDLVTGYLYERNLTIIRPNETMSEIHSVFVCKIMVYSPDEHFPLGDREVCVRTVTFAKWLVIHQPSVL